MTATVAIREVRAQGPSLGLLAVRVGLGGLFIIAAYLKLFASDTPGMSAQSFSEAVRAFRVIQDADLVKLATFTIPWLELVAGVALILGVWTRAAGLILAMLLGLFIALIVSAIDRKLSVTCRCFGDYQLLCKGTVNWCKVGENSVLALLAMTLQTYGGGRYGVDGLIARARGEARSAPQPG